LPAATQSPPDRSTLLPILVPAERFELPTY
jgi:hypothetical protein